jgi:hypothetical protein
VGWACSTHGGTEKWRTKDLCENMMETDHSVALSMSGKSRAMREPRRATAGFYAS